MYQELLALVELRINEQTDFQKIAQEAVGICLTEMDKHIFAGQNLKDLYVEIGRINNTLNLVSAQTGDWLKKDAFLEILKESGIENKILMSYKVVKIN